MDRVALQYVAIRVGEALSMCIHGFRVLYSARRSCVDSAQRMMTMNREDSEISEARKIIQSVLSSFLL